MKYRKKPIVIEAFRYGMDVPTEWSFEGHVIETVCSKDAEYLLIHTLEGVMRANIGDYIIKGIQGELYPCRSDIFEATYEALDE